MIVKKLIISLLLFTTPVLAEFIEMSQMKSGWCKNGTVRIKIIINTDYVKAIEHYEGKAMVILSDGTSYCSVEPYESWAEKHFNKKEKRIR
jgi:hypothetical protein